MENRLRNAVLAAAVFLTALSGAVAAQDQQGQNQQGGEHQGIEGVWDVRLTAVQCTTGAALGTGRAFLMFGPGGRLTSAADNFLHSATLGTWSHLRGQNYTATDTFFVFNADGSLAGTEEVTREIELSTNANEYTATATSEVFDTSDQLISTGCATATATRLFE